MVALFALKNVLPTKGRDVERHSIGDLHVPVRTHGFKFLDVLVVHIIALWKRAPGPPPLPFIRRGAFKYIENQCEALKASKQEEA